jgi:hypothetical protein
VEAPRRLASERDPPAPRRRDREHLRRSVLVHLRRGRVDAGSPERVSWSLTGEGVSFVVPAPDLCEFDVTVTVLVLEAEETYFYDREHQLLRVQTHITQQDAFTNEVSGKTLTGEVYAATVEADFERNETWATGR